MSKADQLGAGRFGGSARPVSARRAAIGAATGVPTEGVAPPNRLPVKLISPNPENPRTALGDLTELAGSLKEHGQKQAVTVMNRDAYIKANPARASDLAPDTTHVVVDGSSRLAAAREAGLTHLNVMVDDEQGSDGDAILESALVANIHRHDLDPLDEARALQRLLAIHGSQVKLAKRLRKSQGWVSQRLALLNLTPELQAAVGEEPVELLRSVAKEPQDRQEAVLQELKAERASKEAERRMPTPAPVAAPSAPVPTAASVTPIAPYEETVPQEETMPTGSAAASAAASRAADAGEGEETDDHDVVPIRQPQAIVPPTRTHRREPQDGPAGQAETVPDPRAAGSLPGDADQDKAEARTARRLPYDDGALLAMHLIREMSDTEFDRMLNILNKHQNERVGAADAH
ncbi:plasmid partitioning protein [Streptomyces atratus]|uniref:ParB/RepB/Spo0J family partition protein n=1 Tax=Streptomyces atratus TaxID=1893 RepID=UPI0016712547|nr:ParB/RepB/Spo0J family partition protein [Streptomyces atratus]GGT72288.1 plasmid partitioning protein [Streptomyces atratus]